MKFIGRTNQLVIDLDEAVYLAKQTVSWNGNTVNDKKIIAAKAALELIKTARKDNRTGSAIAYQENCDI